MNKELNCLVEFQPMGKRIRVAAGTTLLDAARQAGLEMTSVCGGEGLCGQCQVVVLQGDIKEPAIEEEQFFTEIDIKNGRRLACSTRVLGDVKVSVPRETQVNGQRLQIESVLSEIDVYPLVEGFQVALSPPHLDDVRSDVTRLEDKLKEQYQLSKLRINYKVARAVPAILRQQEWQATVFVRSGEIIGLASPDTQPLGLAVDLGTTKIAAYLVSLESGKTLASAGAPNPQIGYGEDVISRLNYARRTPAGAQVLAQKVRQTLNEILYDLIVQVGVSSQQVAEAVIVGNTAMTHLLLRLPVTQLLKAPYVAAVSDALDVRAADIGLDIAKGAYVHIPPAIGGYVGSDHVAMILASELDGSEKISLGVDIGTNTEIVLRKPGEQFLASASCASGPAFEGAHINEGMRAASGAIEKVKIKPDSLILDTIDDEAPVGLCGSGIIDAVAELYRSGLINDRGRFQQQLARVREGEKGGEFLLVSEEESGTHHEIIIDQNDINEIQLAKGAIHAGIKMLLEVTKTAPDDVQEVIIAGAFGSFLNIENAKAIGLFPTLPNAVYKQVGNAAVIGAKWMLISRIARQRAHEIYENTRYTELSVHPRFSREFALGMLFPQKENQ